MRTFISLDVTAAELLAVLERGRPCRQQAPAARRSDQPGAHRDRADRRRTVQQGDRGAALPQRQHRQDPHPHRRTSKIGVRSRIHAAMWAMEHGLVAQPVARTRRPRVSGSRRASRRKWRPARLARTRLRQVRHLALAPDARHRAGLLRDVARHRGHGRSGTVPPGRRAARTRRPSSGWGCGASCAPGTRRPPRARPAHIHGTTADASGGHRAGVTRLPRLDLGATGRPRRAVARGASDRAGAAAPRQPRRSRPSTTR